MPFGFGKSQTPAQVQSGKQAAQPLLGVIVQDALNYLQDGDFEQALKLSAQVLQRSPNHPTALYIEGTIAQQRDQFDKAVELLKQSVAGLPNFYQAHFHLGEALLDQDRLDEALYHFHQVTALQPAHAKSYRAIGAALRKKKKHAQAQFYFSKAIECDPTFVAAYIDFGNALSQDGKIEEAMAVFQKAQELDPDSIASITQKATTLHKAGQTAEAIALLEPLLISAEKHPNLAAAYAKIADTPEHCQKAISSLQKHLENPRIRRNPRMNLYFRLGELLDKEKQYDESFRAFHAGNQLSDLTFDPDTHRRYVDSLIEAYSAATMSQCSRSTLRTELPVFILGMPRSGTSLVEQIIDSHPQAFGAGELGTMGNISARVQA